MLQSEATHYFHERYVGLAYSPGYHENLAWSGASFLGQTTESWVWLEEQVHGPCTNSISQECNGKSSFWRRRLSIGKPAWVEQGRKSQACEDVKGPQCREPEKIWDCKQEYKVVLLHTSKSKWDSNWWTLSFLQCVGYQIPPIGYDSSAAA